MDVATPQREIHSRLAEIGWTAKQVDLRNGVYVAKGVGPAGQKIERTGHTPEMALANLLHFAVRSNDVRRLTASLKQAAWKGDWLDQSEAIAKAYREMPVHDEKAVAAWKALAAESKVQADAIRNQISVEVVDDPEPYADAKEMCEDIHKNRQFKVSRANSDHPVWTEDDNVNFRIVHDVIGHCQSGGNFSWVGTNLAVAHHMPLLTPLAREALFTEAIGQAAYFKHFKGFGQKKVGLLNQFFHPVQDAEGEHVFVPHGGIPNLRPTQGGDLSTGMAQVPVTPGFAHPGDAFDPARIHEQLVPNHKPKKPSVQGKNVSVNVPRDPNHDWRPPVAPDEMMPQVPAGHEGDYLNAVGVVDNAAKIDTEWWELDPATQERAIVNAFRVALLSPRKHLKWNAAHYQAIMHTHPSTKAVDLWNILEEARESHNKSLGHPEGSHLRYRKELEFLADRLMENDPSLTHPEAVAHAKVLIFEKTKEFERLLGHQQEASGWSELKRYNQARKMVEAWMKDNFAPVKSRGRGGWSPGQGVMFTALHHGPTHLFDDSEWEQPEPPKDHSGFASDESKYGAFMGAHLDAIEAVGDHVQEIRALALRDIEEDGGRGFIFRNGVMNLNLPGVNPKVASFAWLLLRPLSSELGIVDTHIMRGLHLNERDMGVRDYYKIERMQRAFKDSTGYQHMPLGLYHWGMWDMIRNPGAHSDHSTLRVLDPVPWDHSDVEWDAASSYRDKDAYVGPPHFEQGRQMAQLVSQQFEEEFGGQPRGRVPHVKDPVTSMKRPLRVLADDEESKFRKLKRKVDDLDAANFGFYAAKQIKVTLKQFEKFLDKEADKHESARWRKFRKDAMESFERWRKWDYFAFPGGE